MFSSVVRKNEGNRNKYVSRYEVMLWDRLSKVDVAICNGMMQS